MVLEILDTAGVFGTPGAYVDMAQYAAYGVEFSASNVDGPNAGTAMDGTTITDVIAHKHQLTFTSQPVGLAVGHKIRAIVQPESFTVRTDLFSGSAATYTMRSTSQKVSLVNHTPNRGDTVQLSFPLIEV